MVKMEKVEWLKEMVVEGEREGRELVRERERGRDREICFLIGLMMGVIGLVGILSLK